MRLKSILLCASALTVAGTSFGQTKVTTGGEKYTLVEEGTGAWCQWCPDGAQVIQEKIEPYGTAANYPRAIIASFHNNYSATSGIDSLTITKPYNDPFNNGTGYIAGFPMGTVDRAPYPTNVGISRGSWPGAVSARNGLSPNFDVSMVCLYDSATRVLTMKVKAKALAALTGTYRINAYITEDSISSSPIGYRQTVASGLTGAGSSSATGTPSWFIGKSNPLASPTVYCHMDAVRRILATTSTGGIWGDAAFTNPAIGDSFEKTYYDTIPTLYKGRTCLKQYTKVIGLVQKYSATSTDRPIENCIEAEVRYMWKELPSTGLTAVTPMEGVKVYPNPATTRLTVKGILENPSAVQISVVNVIGQQVINKTFEKGGSIFGEYVDISELSNGVYFMHIATDGGTVTRQFTVSK
jgi:hypothetical protein